MSEKSDSSVRLFSYEDDQPIEAQGSLIPRRGEMKAQRLKSLNSTRSKVLRSVTRASVFSLALFAFMALGTTGYGALSQLNVAAPIVTIVDPNTNETSNLAYGPQDALAKKSFFENTRDAFIDEGLTFVEADITKKQLRFFDEGVLLQSIKIISVGEKGSWWETPSGLYQVEKKDKQLFTASGQVYLPWLVTFQGNYLIHGSPTYPDNSPVADDYVGGGIRIDDESAKELYKNIKEDMLVLVHSDIEKKDNFVYKPQVLDMGEANYFVVDIGNDAILAASDLEKVLPVASLVKLMTAVVATEKINLDSRINVTSPTFVTSLIPRLAERSSVSMFSLLQLLLVESSNEAAETIAGEVGREEFIEAMNAKARQLGMMNTTFADPSGLSSDNVSSLNDLYLLTKYIHQNKNFLFDITANKKLSTVYSSGEFLGLVNFNSIRGMDSFVAGKVGETIAAKQTSVSLHNLQIQGEERTVVIIVLGSEDRTTDVEKLASYVQNRFVR